MIELSDRWLACQAESQAQISAKKRAFFFQEVSEEINHFILAVCGDDNPFDGSFRKDLTSTPFFWSALFVVFTAKQKSHELLIRVFE